MPAAAPFRLPDELSGSRFFFSTPLLPTMPEHDPQAEYRLSAYDYPLPEHLIAQQPAARREDSRLLVLDCADSSLRCTRFAAVVELLRPGDLIVVNSSKVFPARLLGRKESGGQAELLLLHFPEPGGRPGEAAAQALIRSSKRPKPGSILFFADTLQARVDALLPDGKVQVSLLYAAGADLEQLLDQHGQIPLPPYIRRPEGSTAEDARRYQTEYARRTGSVAAPTAGLHFSGPLLEQIEAMGVRRAEVTLHVGYGTFAPVRSADIRGHRLHEEFVSVPPETAEAVNAVQAAGGRIWAVGTTAARSLEFAADASGRMAPVEGLCGLYIYPGRRFKVVDNLITNLHLPKSSLLFLVAALAGRERLMAAYAEAVRLGCRFFSYGDAMAVVVKR